MKLNTDHGQKNVCILQLFLFCESYLAVQRKGNTCDIVQYIVLHPLFSTKAFLIKFFKNFKEQVKDCFIVTSDSLVKKLGHPA